MFDLTQPLTANIPRFPGDPEFRIAALPSSPPWQISAIAMGTHAGTHLDAPRHCFPDGAGIGAFGPDRLVGTCLVIDAGGRDDDEAISASVLDSVRAGIWPGWFAVIRTGWSRHWHDERYFRHPYLSPELAADLVALGAGLVAIDALSVDSTVAGGSAAHEILLGNDVLIAENLCHLERLEPVRRYACAALPLALGDADGSPARVVAWSPGALDG